MNIVKGNKNRETIENDAISSLYEDRVKRGTLILQLFDIFTVMGLRCIACFGKKPIGTGHSTSTGITRKTLEDIVHNYIHNKTLSLKDDINTYSCFIGISSRYSFCER